MASAISRDARESFDEYLVRLFSNKNAYGLSCQGIADLLNKENGASFNESTYRKDWASFVRWRKYMDEHAMPTGDAELKRQLMEERVKLRDERTELNRLFRKKARADDMWQQLAGKLAEEGRRAFPPISGKYVTCAEGSVVVCLSDLHYGLVIRREQNAYDPDIAWERLARYARSVKQAAQESGYRRCVVALMGDMISGNIHNTCRLNNRENIIDQVKGVSQLVSRFIWEISGEFDGIRVVSVSGNHSRLESREDALNEERLDKLVPWYLKASLGHLKNIEVLDDDDSTLAVLEIEGHTYWFVHGDMDACSEEAVYRLAAARHLPLPHGVFFGHMHTNRCAFGGIALLQSGCLSGAGDDYTTRKRLGASPVSS